MRNRTSLAAILLIFMTTHPLISLAASKPSCQAPEYHQFDFWIGDWDAYDTDNPNIVSARIKVDRILEACVLHEDYQDTSGHKGQSFSIYDASRRVWHQSWVTNRGELLVIEGTYHSGEIILTGTDKDADGKERLVRGTWKAVPEGVRESAVRSTDGGQTWTPWFDIIFRRHRP